MYSTCLFCQHRLGSNETFERFPVGRRLAFDSVRGRLWVVCPHCTRWNLSPLDERWEALEECERRFRGTRLRVATENVGLARLAEGTDLIRVGRPLRPEFAGWRYGRELMRRRRKDLMGGLGAVGGVGIAALSIPLLAFVAPAAAIAAPFVGTGGLIAAYRIAARRVVARERDRAGELRLIRVKHLRDVVFLPGTDEDDTLSVMLDSDAGWLTLRGGAAERVAAVVCARRNQVGGSERQVGDAVRFLEERGGPDAILDHVAGRGAFNGLRYLERLALEISLHEELERRALDGELYGLEQAWRAAEEIAAIADRLLVPPSVDAWLDRIRDRGGPLP